MPGRQELPSTLERSPREAQRTWIKAHDSAVEEYGEGERAHRVAYGALKHTYEKVGDHYWERKEGGRKGPSDPQSGRPRQQGGRSGEGVDEKASKEHLYGVAGAWVWRAARGCPRRTCSRRSARPTVPGHGSPGRRSAGWAGRGPGRLVAKTRGTRAQ